MLALSPDGRLLASAGEKQSVLVRDLSTNEVIQELNGHTGDALAAVFSRDGRRLVTSAEDCTVRIWESRDASWREVLADRSLVFRGHTGHIQWVAISPDGRRIVSSSQTEQAARVWDLDGLSDD